MASQPGSAEGPGANFKPTVFFGAIGVIALLILFAVLTDSSIGELFLGGVGPGLLLSAGFAGWIVLIGLVRPDMVGKGHEMEELDERVRRRMLLPVLLLAAIVLGGIYLGFFTPTEAGAVGAFAALAIAFGMRRLDAAYLAYLERSRPRK